jgi:hypothetical protein
MKPWRVKQWCIPPRENAAFVAAMEDVLEVYTRPYDPRRPQVCMDEKAVQLIGETRQPLPVKAGREARYDFEYARRGVTNLFMCFEPLAARRQVMVRSRRGARQWAEVMRELVDVHYPGAERVVVVLDNLNTHALSSLYEVFEPEEARRVARKLELHYTPKHGSWLNMAEIEISVLARQCLKRRLASEEELAREAAAWTQSRNGSEATVDWRFTTDDARIKLKRLYPSLQPCQ